MTGKLLKLQLRESWRIVGPISAVTLLIILITSFTNYMLRDTAVPKLLNPILFLITSGIFMAISLIVIYVDYQNMYGQRAYFFRAIPCKTSQLFISRFFYVFINNILIYLIQMVVSFGFLFAATNEVGIKVLSFMRSMTLPNILWFSVFALVATAFSTAIIMASISLGSEQKLNRFGIGGPIIVYFIIYIINQIGTIASMLFLPFSLAFKESADSLKVSVNFSTKTMFSYILESIKLGGNKQEGFLGIGFIFYQIIMMILLIYLTNRSMDKKLTLR